MPSRRAAMILALAVSLSACSAAGQSTRSGAGPAVDLRLGYFPNVTHAPGLVGVSEGILASALGDDVNLTAQAFNAGGDAIEALFNGAIDATYIGPNPAINGFTRSDGQALRIVSGATSGGALFVVRPGVTTSEDLIGTTLGSPGLGNTQDVALRSWLLGEGLETDLEGGGDVSIAPQANGQILDAFVAGSLDGAWVPEPWATRMISEGDGHVLVDEADLWPGGQFVTTHLIVATAFLDEHPDVVKRLLAGHIAAIAFVNERPEEAQASVASAIEELTGGRLPEGTLATAWQNLTFTVDPIADSLFVSARNAKRLGLLESDQLEGIYDLTLLNELRREAGEPEIQAP